MRQNIAEEQRIFDEISYESIYSEETYDKIIGYFKSTYISCNSFLPSIPRIADIGCGQADFGVRFAKEIGAARFFALDIAINLLDKIKAKTATKIHGDAFRLPFKDNSIDILIAAAIIHHFPEYPLLLREFHRVLSPRSLMLIFEPNGNSIKELLTYCVGRYFYRNVFTKNEFPISPYKLQTALFSQGFIDIKMQPVAIAYKSKKKKSLLGKFLELIEKSRKDPFSTFPFYLLSCVCNKSVR